jgi:subtilisin family serine protease
MSGLRQAGLLLLVIAVVVAAGCHSGTGHDSQEAAAAAPAAVGTAQEPVQSLGDMNEDGVASVTDAIAILRIVVGFDPYTPRADADNSGAAGVADAILVLRAVVGLGAWPIAPPDIFDNQIASTAPDAEVGEVDLPDGSQVNAALTHVILNISGNATSLDGWDLQQYLAQTGSTIAAWEPGLRQIVVETPDVQTTEDYLEDLPTLAAVDLAMPNIDARPTQASVFDPDPATFAGDYWMDQIRAREAWKVAVDTRGEVNSDVILGVVDTGIDVTNHFSVDQVETVGAALLGDGTDEVGHGTNVAGLMVAPGNDTIGACGIAWGNRIKVVDWWEQTAGAQFSFDIAQGIRVAIDAGAAVVNVSAGANTYSYDGAGNVTGILPHDACIILQQRFRMNMTPAVRYAMDQGALVVFAAGNDGEVVKDDDVLLPAGAPAGWADVWASNAMIVAATTSVGIEANYSREGAVVDIAAPGTLVGTAGAGVYQATGTSFAAPIVAGIAGLVWSFDPSLTPQGVKDLIVASGGQSRTDIGGGIANALRALPAGGGTIIISWLPRSMTGAAAG